MGNENGRIIKKKKEEERKKKRRELKNKTKQILTHTILWRKQRPTESQTMVILSQVAIICSIRWVCILRVFSFI